MRETRITVSVDGCLISGTLIKESGNKWVIGNASIFDRFRTLQFTEKIQSVSVNPELINFWYVNEVGNGQESKIIGGTEVGQS